MRQPTRPRNTLGGIARRQRGRDFWAWFLTERRRRRLALVGGVWSDCLAHYALDEASGVRYDSLGARHLTDNNSVGVAGGMLGNAASFNNSNLWLSYGADIVFNLANTRSISCWIKPTGSTGYDQVICGCMDTQWCLIFTSGQKVRLDYIDGSAGYRMFLHSDVWAYGSWIHVVAWRDASTGELGIAVNGNPPQTRTDAYGLAAFGAPAFRVGKTASGYYFNGAVDELAFFGHKLSESEITYLFNGGEAQGYVAP